MRRPRALGLSKIGQTSASSCAHCGTDPRCIRKWSTISIPFAFVLRNIRRWKEVACFRSISAGSNPSINRLVNVAASISSASAHPGWSAAPRSPPAAIPFTETNDVRVGRRASLPHFPLPIQCRVDLSSPIQVGPRAMGKGKEERKGRECPESKSLESGAGKSSAFPDRSCASFSSPLPHVLVR